MTKYWVTGGEFATTEFKDMAAGATPQRFGPYETYEDARAAWLSHSFANVDNCNVRFTIVRDDQAKASSAAA